MAPLDRMREPSAWLLVARSVAMFGMLLGCRASAPPLLGESVWAHRFDSLVPGLLAEHQVPGVQIAVVDDGEVVWQGGYGIADRVTGRRVDSGTLFNLGSVSKIAATWGIMALLEPGTPVGLDTPVQGHLVRWRIPESSRPVDRVTPRRLLSHTSGLSAFPASESFSYPEGLGETLARSYGSFGRLRLVREPGKGFEYNNGNFLVLQLFLEDLTGRPLPEYLRERVFLPLGMRVSGYAGSVDVAAIATPHDGTGQPLPFYPTYHNVNFAASGGLYSTAGEFAKLVAATMPGPGGAPPGRGVLLPETVRLMLAPVPETGGVGGLGYRILPVSQDLRLIGHDGANPGWKAGFLSVPERGVGIVFLTNSERGGAIIAPIICAWSDWETAIELVGLCDGPRPVAQRR